MRTCGQTVGRCKNSFFTPDKQLFATSPIEPAAYLFDGVAAIALAADAALNTSKKQNAPLGSMLLEELLRLSFDGASGLVALDARGDRKPATIQFALGSLALETTSITYNISSTFVLGKFGMDATSRAPVQWIDGGKKQPPDAHTREVCPAAHSPSFLKPPALTLAKQRVKLLPQKWQLLAQARRRSRRKQDLAQREEKNKQEAARQKQEAARRERSLVVGTVVGILMAIVVTLGPAIWLVRVRRVAALYLTVTGQTVTGRAVQPDPHRTADRLTPNRLSRSVSQVSKKQLIRDSAAAKARAAHFGKGLGVGAGVGVGIGVGSGIGLRPHGTLTLTLTRA